MKQQREIETSRKADEALRSAKAFEARELGLISPAIRHVNAHGDRENPIFSNLPGPFPGELSDCSRARDLETDRELRTNVRADIEREDEEIEEGDRRQPAKTAEGEKKKGSR